MTIEPISNNSVETHNGEKKMIKPRYIFREETRQHYLANQEKIEFPRLLSSKFFTVLWIMAFLLFLLGSLVTFWPLIESWMWG